jgi:hypothetical protein
MAVSDWSFLGGLTPTRLEKSREGIRRQDGLILVTAKEEKMKREQFVPVTLTALALGAMVLGGMIITSPRAHASEQSEIQTVFDIVPVTLNLQGKNHDLVGLGSYTLNAQGLCDECHRGPGAPYLPGENPFFGQHTSINPANCLGGCLDFGTLDASGQSPHIHPRNLTPDKTGSPESDQTLSEFINIMSYFHIHFAL